MDLVELQNDVEGRAMSGCPFDEIEDIIEDSPLPDNTKAALWLLAWSYQPPQVRVRVAKEALAAVDA